MHSTVQAGNPFCLAIIGHHDVRRAWGVGAARRSMLRAYFSRWMGGHERVKGCDAEVEIRDGDIPDAQYITNTQYQSTVVSKMRRACFAAVSHQLQTTTSVVVMCILGRRATACMYILLYSTHARVHATRFLAISSPRPVMSSLPVEY